MNTQVITALNPRGKISQIDRVRAYRRGRICAQPECDTILSIYNPARYCSAHVHLATNGRRRGAARVVREVACEQCATVFETGNGARKFCSDRCRMAAFARRKRAAQRAKRRAENERSLHLVAPVPADQRASDEQAPRDPSPLGAA
jgi:endogenous inhibitor of DNA gyrase (YacG/DUF329 family)